MPDQAIIGTAAQAVNPALRRLDFLLGEWRTEGTHPQLAGQTLNGRTSFKRHEGGAFVIMRTHVDHPEIPDGMAIIGSDDGAGTFAMVYFDERGISRLYDLTIGERTLTWRRDDPQLAQTNTIKAGDDEDILIGKGRMSQNGGAWGEDLSQTFHRDAQR